MRSWRVDHVGDVIEWGWVFCTLSSYWADLNYITQEQDPLLWLGVNLALALTYALVIALIVDRVLARRKHRG